jgi:glycosyltransferase involved in cell wall biosynthesis
VLAATDINGVTAAEIRDAEAGVVVPAGDPAALLGAAVRLADNHEAGQRLGISGRRYACRLLGAERALNEYEGWCRRLIESHPNSTH